MAGDCTHIGTRCYANSERFCTSKALSPGDGEGGMMESGGRGPNFEVIDGQLYRKKLERGFINYREVLDEDRRHEALSAFHLRRRPGQRHLSFEETYKCVAENYWWEEMYFQIRDFVLGCPECQSQRIKETEELSGGRRCVTKTVASHADDMLSRLRSQREAGLLCDITLRTNGRSYSAHRAVLAAVSDHFQEIFTDSSMKADVDLTGFSEDSLLSLLDFSYSSTLCVRQEDLPEVIAMARHLGMWPAVEACSALIKEQEQKLLPDKGFASACAAGCAERHRHQKEGKRKRGSGSGDGTGTNGNFSLTLDASDDSLEESPRRNLRRTPKPTSHNGLPLSPSHRMKLMDFKSPSSKKATASPRHSIATPQSLKYSPTSTSNGRLLRSTPGAAKELQRLLPKQETPRRSKKPQSVAQLPRSARPRLAVRSPVRVKQEVVEVGEDEEDYARAQEKYQLMFVLGLQRTALLPRPEDLIGWRQKKRLRKLKANDYSLTKRREPRSISPVRPYGNILSLPLCINPITTRILSKSAKAKSAALVRAEQVSVKKPKTVRPHVPPSDRSMRSKCVLPDLFQPASRSPFGGRELRRSVRNGDSTHLIAQQPLRRKTMTALVRNTVRIKSEPAEYDISGFTFPLKNHHGHTPKKSPPSPGKRARDKVTMETVKTLRYNSGRTATKAKQKRGSAREVEKRKSKPREEGRKAGGQGQRGLGDTRPRTEAINEPGGLQYSEHTPPPPPIHSHPLYKVIKEEPADPVPVGVPFSDPPSPDLGKRQSKPPIKLLDSGFLFSFCRPVGALKKEEESVDICLTRSVSQVGGGFGAENSPHRALRARPPAAMPPVKKERQERSVSHGKPPRRRANPRNNNTLHLTKPARSKATKTMPKQVKPPPLSGRSCNMPDAVRRARLKQLRGPRSQAPKVPKSAHACLQCPAAYGDCDSLIMHRLRHIEGKHWPCLLCSKTFFRLRNVRNHIRTHDPKLYKCRSCIAAGS